MFKLIVHSTLVFLTLGCVSLKLDKSDNASLSQLAFKDISAELKQDIESLYKVRFEGPLKTIDQFDLSLKLNKDEQIIFDYSRPLNDESAPLVIFHHGNKYIKEAHWNQARMLSSWGFHAITIQSKNEYNWINNGRRLHYLVNLISKSPGIISPNIDQTNIILAGHSFGGSAVTVAASLNKKVKGVILLDPAVVSNSVYSHQKNVESPTILLGADEKVFLSRRRPSFMANIPSLIHEVSVKGATHNAAQNPTITEHIWGFDPTTSKRNIFTFTHLITASAFALSNHDHLENLENLFETLKRHGRLSKFHSKPRKISKKVPSVEELDELGLQEF
jgi:hypothetical protein